MDVGKILNPDQGVGKIFPHVNYAFFIIVIGTAAFFEIGNHHAYRHNGNWFCGDNNHIRKPPVVIVIRSLRRV
jgi:hypothetical protein